MATYALIDNDSGYLWAILEASDPLLAAQTTDENLGCYGRRYEERRIIGTSQTGYHVFDVTGLMSPDEPGLNGQDPETIARAERGRKVAEIACLDGAP